MPWYDPFLENLGPFVGGVIGAVDAANGVPEQKPYMAPGQERLIGTANDAAVNQFGQGPMAYYPGQTVADLDPNQVAGQNQRLGSTAIQQQLANAGGTAAMSLAQGGAGRIGGFQLPDQIGFGLPEEYQNAIMNPVMRDLEERTIPGLHTAATSQGAFGGSRMQQQKSDASAQATERATEALIRGNLDARGQSIGQRAGDISAQLTGRGQDITQNQLHNTALANSSNAITAGQSQQLVPGQTQTQVGNERFTYDQDRINADINRFDFNRNEAISNVDRLFNRAAGNPAPIQGDGGRDSTFLDYLKSIGIGANIGGGLTTPPWQ